METTEPVRKWLKFYQCLEYVTLKGTKSFKLPKIPQAVNIFLCLHV